MSGKNVTSPMMSLAAIGLCAMAMGTKVAYMTEKLLSGQKTDAVYDGAAALFLLALVVANAYFVCAGYKAQKRSIKGLSNDKETLAERNWEQQRLITDLKYEKDRLERRLQDLQNHR
ncbi:hypothetical protein HDR63_02055 [bacterium]|nr:hypothetical protein [bacterium]